MWRDKTTEEKKVKILGGMCIRVAAGRWVFFGELGTAGEIKEGNKDKCVSVLCSLQGRFCVIASEQK